jgi:rRNA maturation endonuclease Nob1
MIINGKWMSEPEIIALISQLTAEKEKLEKQAVKSGYWTDLNNDAIYHYECSCCKGHTDWHENFCPNCGADMRGTEI